MNSPAIFAVYSNIGVLDPERFQIVLGTVYQPIEPSNFSPASFSLTIYPKDSRDVHIDNFSDVLPLLRTNVVSESISLNFISNSENDTITSNFVLTVAGSYSVVVFFNGSLVSSFMQTITVFPGEPFFPNFQVVRTQYIIKTSEIIDVIVAPVDQFMNSFTSSFQLEMLDLEIIVKDDSDQSLKYPFVLGADNLFVSSFRITKSGQYKGNVFIASHFQIPSAILFSVIQASTVSADTSSIFNMNTS